MLTVQDGTPGAGENDAASTGQDTPPTPAIERVDVATAAARLGLTVEGVRKRIQRRQIAAERDDGRWYVLLGAPPPSQSSPGQDRPRKPSRTRRDAGEVLSGPVLDKDVHAAQGPPSGPGQDAYREMIDLLKDEVAHLRRQVESFEVERSEMRRLLAAFAQRLPELPPAQPDSSTNPSSSENPSEGATPPAPRAPWWRRLLLRQP